MIIALPILLPFFAILLLLLAGKRILLQKIIATTIVSALTFISILIFFRVNENNLLVSYAGDWKAPYGITLVVDRLSAIMLLISSVLSFCITFFSFRSLGKQYHVHRFYVFFFGMLMGVNGTFVTGDIFNMYVWFEVMLISSFILMVLGNKRQQLEGGIKYLVINLVGSMFFLGGIGVLYGFAGTLNLAHLSANFRGTELPPMLNLSMALILTAFGIKAAIFPFYFWLPTSYHTPRIAIAAFFAGLLTKVGIYTMIRIMTLFFTEFNSFWHNLILAAAVATMIFGAVSAFAQNDLRRLLSFSIISQMGYLIMGIGFFTPLALAATIFFLIHNALVKTNLYLIGGIMARIDNSYRLEQMGGGYYRYPGLAVIFILSAMALAGLPPLTGFFGKFLLAKAGMETGHFFVAGSSLFTGLITIAYMFKVWNQAFWKASPEKLKDKHNTNEWSLFIAPLILLVIILSMSLWAGNIFEVMKQAAEQLMEPSGYINEILKIQELK